MNIQTAREKLSKLSTLESNWDSYGAEPPNKFALKWAAITLDILEEIDREPNAVVPSVENGIGICFSKGDKYADIEFFNEGEILAVYTEKFPNGVVSNPNVWEVEVSKVSIREALEVIHNFINEQSTKSHQPMATLGMDGG